MGRKSCHSSLFSVVRPLSKNDTGGQNGPCFCFPQTVICYLLSVTQKFVFGNCQLSTVTLGIDDIDLSCDMMKNKPQKIWNISLLFVYLQRTMVQIQKLIFHILKDFKEAVCEYRLFSIFYARSASWISAPT